MAHADALTPTTMAAQAHAAAAAEGPTLVPAENATGFMGVSSSSSATKPFKAQASRGGRQQHLGCFATAEEAALAVARFLGPEGVAAALAPPEPKPAPMTAAEAHAAAAAEGLALRRAENPAGFKHVAVANGGAGSKLFMASVRQGGRKKLLGRFVTAEEAALAVARFLGPEGVAAALAADAAKASEPAPMTAAEAHATAAAEGLALLRAKNSTGFKGVSRLKGRTKPFQASVKHSLGYFTTAEEAALAVARFLGPEGVAAALVPEHTPMTAAEAHAAAAAEGLTLLRAENPAGFKNVGPSRSPIKPFRANVRRHGHDNYQGSFATAEEAALAVARFLGPAGVAASLAEDAAKALEPAPMTASEAHAAAASEGLTLVRAENPAGFKFVSRASRGKPFQAQVKHGRRHEHLGSFTTAEEAALAVARFLGPAGAAPPPGLKRPADAGPSAPPGKRVRQPADEEAHVVKAEAVSDDDDDGPPTPPTAPPVLCYCERPAALLDGRWVCAQLVEGDFCILGREDE
jgi:hypothetical protein